MTLTTAESKSTGAKKRKPIKDTVKGNVKKGIIDENRIAQTKRKGLKIKALRS